MLPEFLAGSYQRYKNDTNVFTTWLIKTAEASGYTSSAKLASPVLPKQTESNDATSARTQTLAERLRAQAEKKAKRREGKASNQAQEEELLPTVNHLIPTQELLRQAEAVSRNAKAIVPDAIVQVLERAILARKRCASWFQSTGLEKQNTEGHLHFVSILEKTLTILKPDYTLRKPACSPVPASANAPEKPEVKGPTPHHDLSGLSNRFSNLEVEDTEDIVETGTTLLSLSTNSKVISKNATKRPRKSIDVFELDYDDTFDRMFDVYCFFEDLHRIQDFLNAMWTKFKRNEIDLITASITTNVAFNLARKEELELTSNLFKSEKLDYNQLVSVIFSLDSLKSSNHGQVDQLRITPFDNFVFLSTARSVQKFEKLLEYKVQYPQPVPPARMSYVFNQEMLNLPEVRRMEREDEFISQYLMDLTLQSQSNMMMSQLHTFSGNGDSEFKQYQTEEAPCDDEFTRGFERMRVQGEVSTWMVFACRILIDIQEILGEKTTQGWALWKESACFSKQNLHVNKDLIIKKRLMEMEGLAWNPTTSELDLLTKIWEECSRLEIDVTNSVKKRILAGDYPGWSGKPKKYYQSYDEAISDRPDLMGKIQDDKSWPADIHPEIRQLTKRINLQPIQPSQEESFIYARNPIFCGLKLFELSLLVESAGTLLEGYHHTIFSTAHLYNAAIQAGLIDSRWPEMDFFIESHISTLFAGILPDNKFDCRTRYMLQLGTSPTAFAKSARTKKAPPKKLRPGMENGPQIPRAKATNIFREYFAKTKSMEKTLYGLEALVQDEKDSSTSTTKSKSKNTSKAQQRAPRQLTSIQLLKDIQSYLPASVQQMQFDYISLVRTCHEIMRKLMKGIEELKSKELDGDIDVHDFDPALLFTSSEAEAVRPTVDTRLIMLPLDILGEEAGIHAVSEQLFRKEMKAVGSIQAGPKLRLAAEAIRRFAVPARKLAAVEIGIQKDLETTNNKNPENSSSGTNGQGLEEKAKIVGKDESVGKGVAKSTSTTKKPKSDWEARAARAFQ